MRKVAIVQVSFMRRQREGILGVASVAGSREGGCYRAGTFYEEVA